MPQRTLHPALVLTLALALAAAPAAAQQPEPTTVPTAEKPIDQAAEPVAVSMLRGPITVDGSLEDEAWEGAQVVQLRYETFPADNAPPPVETECRVAFDDANLYIGCVARDPDPSQIRANYTDRDRALQDDHMIFLIDPFNDRRRGFQFRVNPLGVQMDAIFATDFEDFSWDAIWASAGRVTDDGYVVEVAIPFKSLRFPRQTGIQTWGFIAERVWPRSSRTRIRHVPNDRSNSCLLCQAGQLTGFHDISPGRDVELNPTVTASRTDARAEIPAGRIIGGDVEAEPGLNLRWGVTPNVSLNATLNPDFSQVETDAAQLDVNTRFALSFPEKRPFFLEGADIFRTMIPVIFTRTVRDPVAGVKASGKEGSNAFGFFAARDEETGLLFPANQGSRSTLLDREVNTAVLRYRRDVGNSSTIGGVYTGRIGEDYGNHVASLDAAIRLSRSNTFTAQYVHTETDYPDSIAAAFQQPQGRFGADAAIAQLTHTSRNWQAFAQFQEIGRELRGDVGFLPRVDARVYRARVQRAIWAPPGSWYTRLGFAVLAQHLADMGGRVTDRGANASFSYEGPKQSSFFVYEGLREELFAGTMHELRERGFTADMRPNGQLSLALRGDFGDAVDYSNGREARITRLVPAIGVQAGRHLIGTLEHAFERLETPGGARIFDANLTQGRVVYNFTARAFVRAIVQYRDVQREQAQYGFPVQPEQRNIASQLLFSYKVNPQTVVFLGYSDNYLGREEFSTLQTDRTFFLKLGYAWRL